MREIFVNSVIVLDWVYISGVEPTVEVYKAGIETYIIEIEIFFIIPIDP